MVNRHENTGGLSLPAQHVEALEPCRVCGVASGVLFGGVPLHLPCFWRTTAATVEQLQQLGRAPEPASVALPAAGGRPAPSPRRRSEPSAAGDPAAPRRRFAAPAAVVSADTAFLPGGQQVPWDATVVPHLGEVATLVGADRLALGWGGGEDRLPDLGQVWLTTDAVQALGLPASLPVDDKPRTKALEKLVEHPMVTTAVEAGWEVKRVGMWTRIWHPQLLRSGALLVMLPWNRLDGVALYGDDPAPGELADRLHRFAAATQVSYRITPAATGLDLIDHFRPPRKDRDDMLGQGRGRVAVVRGPAELPPFLQDTDDTRVANIERDFSWHRPYSTLLEQERAARFVHGYDRNASYLTPWRNLELGVERLVHRTGADAVWDGSEKPGYFLVEDWDWPHWHLPDPGQANGGRFAGAGKVWVTVHTLRQLSRHGITPAVHESYTWEVTARYLDRAGETLVKARKDLDPTDPALATIKGMYASTIGKLGQREHRVDDHLWRPDWRHHDIAATRTAILHTLTQIAEGPTPAAAVMVDHDLIVFTSDEPDPVKAWPGDPAKLNDNPGGWKVYGSALLEQWGEQFLVERPRTLRGIDAGQALKNGEVGP